MSIKVCRACLQKEEQLVDSKNDSDIIIQAFVDLANIALTPSNEKWPLCICDECLRKLKEFSEFRRQIIESNDFFVEASVEDSLHTEKNLDQLLRRHWGQKDLKIQYKSAQNQLENSKILNRTNPQDTEVQIKDEFHTFPVTEVFESAFVDELTEQIHCTVKVKKEKKRDKKKLKNSKTQHTRHKAPRTLIEVDPAKITVLELSKEEQFRDQKAEGEKASYKDKPFRCEKCFKGFNFERKLRSHDENYHKPNSPYKCDVCTRTMRNAASLAIHLKKHQFIYQCNTCFLRFAEKPRAILHYKSVHEGIAVQYSCKHCGRVFGNRSSLNGHLRNQHPETARPQCELCLKTFATKDSLLNHKLIHTGEKSHACQICDKRFRLRQSVAKHMLSHSSLRAHYCPPCDVSFKSRAALSSHLRHAAAHAEPRAMADAMLQNTCEQCGRGFATRHRLASHAARHAGRRPGRPGRSAPQGPKDGCRYVCHQCGRGFAARRTLDNHVLTHSGARPHGCPHCAARFTQRATLRSHLARLHAEPTTEGTAVPTDVPCTN